MTPKLQGICQRNGSEVEPRVRVLFHIHYVVCVLQLTLIFECIFLYSFSYLFLTEMKGRKCNLWLWCPYQCALECFNLFLHMSFIECRDYMNCKCHVSCQCQVFIHLDMTLFAFLYIYLTLHS